MAAIPLRIRGLNVVLVVFSLLVMGGAAVAMNSAQIFKSGASNLIQSATGKLVKKGTPEFSPCKNAATTYALIGAQPTTPVNAQVTVSPRPSGKPTSPTPACTPLSVQSSIADPLVGQRVVATGTFTNGVFYATSLALANPASPSAKPSGHPTPKATCLPRPACLDSRPPCLPPEPVGGFCR